MGEGGAELKIIILAGGGGTRLFPLSRKCMPKQFLSIDQEISLLGETIERFKSLIKPSDIIIVTNKNYVDHVRNELVNCNANDAHIVMEPVSRNTAPAIVLAAQYCLDNLSCGMDEVLFVSTSDHIIRPAVAFQNAVMKAVEVADKGHVVTFGIKPTKPETGFGYIETGEHLGGLYKIKAFKEKPDMKKAEQYFESDSYYWNSGLYAFTIGCYLKEISQYANAVQAEVRESYIHTLDNFANMPDISIDYAVAEKSKIGIIIPLNLYWNDVGSWDAIYDILDKDTDGNALKGDCITIDCQDNLIFGKSRLIAAIGLKDIMVVETEDVILVAQKGESQKVKNIVNVLKQRGRKEAIEHTTIYSTWGTDTLLGEGVGYKMKKLVVRPEERLEMKMHYHRSVHWVVTRGSAEVTIDDKKQIVHNNESIFIPKTTRYGLFNPGKIPLVIIEVENGEYLENDDIILG